jgi:hypothetical protein
MIAILGVERSDRCLIFFEVAIAMFLVVEGAIMMYQQSDSIVIIISIAKKGKDRT